MRRSFLLAVLGLAVLTQPVSVSLAGGPKKGDPSPPVVTAPKDPATLTDKEIAKALEPFTVAITTGDKNAATEALLTLLKDPAQTVYHGIAWGQYANMLRAADMEYASLLAAGQAITLDPPTTRTRSRVLWPAPPRSATPRTWSTSSPTTWAWT